MVRDTPPQGRSSSQSLCCGRVLCDVKLSAKELIRARSYDLTGELCPSSLPISLSLTPSSPYHRAGQLLAVSQIPPNER